MFYTIVLAFLLVILTTTYWYVKRKYFGIDDRTKNIPGLKPEWYYGNLRNTGITSGEKATYEALAELKEKYGDVFKFWLGSTCCVTLSRVEHVRHVLSDRQTYEQAENILSGFTLLFPTALISLRGNDWKRHARFLIPLYRRIKITSYFDAILGLVDRLINQHFVHNNSEIHTDLVAQCEGLLLNIVARLSFGYDPEESSSTPELRQAFNDYVRYGAQLFLNAMIPHWATKLYLMLHWKFQRSRRIVKQYVMQVITEEKNRQEQDSTRSNKSKHLIASLMTVIKEESSSSTEPSLTSDEIFDELSMANVASFETTASALSWFIFYMSKYPDIQQKIKDELLENHLTPDASLTQETLDSLVYVECVTKELLRFAPIDAFLARQAIRDDMIDDIPVKKGDTILIAHQNLHRDPRYWNVDPSKFMPERFLEEDESPPHCAYLPFGGGHRGCAGKDLAFFELKIAITRLMQRVTFEDPGEEADNSGGFIESFNCFPENLAVRVHMDSDKKD